MQLNKSPLEFGLTQMVITGLDKSDRLAIVDNSARRTQLIAFRVVTANRPYSSQIIPSPLALISSIKTLVTTLTYRCLEENGSNMHTLRLKFFSPSS